MRYAADESDYQRWQVVTSRGMKSSSSGKAYLNEADAETFFSHKDVAESARLSHNEKIRDIERRAGITDGALSRIFL